MNDDIGVFLQQRLSYIQETKRGRWKKKRQGWQFGHVSTAEAAVEVQMRKRDKPLGCLATESGLNVTFK